MMKKRILCMLICAVLLCSIPCSAEDTVPKGLERLDADEVQDELRFVLEYLGKLHQALYVESDFNVASDTYIYLDDEDAEEVLRDLMDCNAEMLIGLLPYGIEFLGSVDFSYLGDFMEKSAYDLVKRYPYFIRDKVSARLERFEEVNALDDGNSFAANGTVGELVDIDVKRGHNGILYFNLHFTTQVKNSAGHDIVESIFYNVCMREYEEEYLILLIMEHSDGVDFPGLGEYEYTYDEWLALRDEKQNGVAATEESDTSPTQAEQKTEPSTAAQMPPGALEVSLAVAAAVELAVIVLLAFLLLRSKKDK